MFFSEIGARGGGGGTHYNGQYGEAAPERGSILNSFQEMKYIKWWGNLAVTLVFIKGDLT